VANPPRKQSRDEAPSPLPAVSLPRGGGAIQGVGEKLVVNPATGTAAFSVPVFTSPGRSGFGPKLALDYDSGGGNTPFGQGWSMAVPAVSRKTAQGLPRYRDEDTFILNGAEDLVPLLVQGADGWEAESRAVAEGGKEYRVRRYRPRTEGTFLRIERWEGAAGGEHWRVVSRDNVTSVYGRGEEARIADPEAADRTFSWLLEESRDDRGNVVSYAYAREDDAGVDDAMVHERNRRGPQANRYLKRITYGNTTPGDAATRVFEVVLDYGDHDPDAPSPEADRPWPLRADAFSTHRAGFEVRTRRLCRRVLMFHHFAELGTAPRLVRSTDFIYQERPDATRLAGVTSRGYVPGRAPDETPPLRFVYTEAEMGREVQEAEAPHLPEGVDGGRYRWVDLDGEGAAGILAEAADAWFYARNEGAGRFGRFERVAEIPSTADLAGGQQLMDLDGSGRTHLVQYAGTGAGYYARAAGGAVAEPMAWEGFRVFPSMPRVDWSDPNLRFVDVDGDGRADVLLAGDHLFTWFPSRGADGFGAPETASKEPVGRDEERGPALVFADVSQSIHLADMTGDGLADIVRIRNGDVCYWPNLGYGRFGARVAMGGAPVFDHPDRWDPRRLRLADVDGTGTTDLVYLGGAEVGYWTNQAGNGWSARRVVPAFPATDSLSTVAVTDLLGTGTACLVWSSPAPEAAGRALRYVKLTEGKPHLLHVVENGQGAETRIHYAPSTRFFLRDREAGRPWATRLPFPVQVVERTETLDHVAGHRSVTRYAYAHGCWDGTEREFRGFGRVDQWDAEEWTGGEDPLDQPPVLTRSWFHTGVWSPEGGPASRHAAEFWKGDPDAWAFPESVLPGTTRPTDDLPPTGLSTDELREAWRALRGKPIRREVHAEDGSPESVHPYTVSEHAYEVECIQPRGGHPHAVFVARERESRSWHYERDPADPRVQQQLTLAVDEYGHVLRSATVGYPRRAPAGPAAAEQARAWITVAESTVANREGESGRRIGVPVATTTYEVTGIAVAASAPLTAAAVREHLRGAIEIPYEAEPIPGRVRTRAVQRTRTLYWADDLAGPLPLGEPGTRALPYETLTAAFSPALAAAVFGEAASDAVLRDEGGYRLWDGLWWAPSARVEVDPARFFLPVSAVDAWGNRSRVEYDAYSLFVAAAHDALPAPRTNTALTRHHYRTLLPWLQTDANGNRAAVRFDGLGRVTAAAAMGREGAGEGDTLDLRWDEAAPGDDPTTTVEYDSRAWAERRDPCRVVTRIRERHADPATRWQESHAYSDGRSREVLKKVRAEPGPAPFRDAAGEVERDEEGRPALRHADPRWVGTGRVVLNNKGNPVRAYEPYFAGDAGFDSEADLVEHGVAPMVSYDPLDRVVRTDFPDGTFSSVQFDPWTQRSWDANDNVLASAWYAMRSELPADDPARRAARLAAAHAGTPSVAHLDSLGRPVVTEALHESGAAHATRVSLDVEGNQLALTDARGNTTIRQTFGEGGRALRIESSDAGTTVTLPDAAGTPIRAWGGTEPGRRAFRFAFDELRRPTHRWVRAGADPEILAEWTVYGEIHPDAAARALRGHPFRVYDGAGAATSERYDFKGNLATATRHLGLEYRERTDWTAVAALADLDAIDAATRPLVEPEPYTVHADHDALNRPVRLVSPDGSVSIPRYNEASLLDGVGVRVRGAAEATTIVADVEYDARGERVAVMYGSGVRTEYRYDPDTQRLARLRTVRLADGARLHDLTYTRDAVGNVTTIRDRARQTVFFANEVVASGAEYQYDALYRLVRAEGREHAGQLPPDGGEYPLNPVPHANDALALRRYVEEYRYDAAGNLEEMTHRAGGGVAWRRAYGYDPASNRLATTEAAGVAASYPHDGFGNIVALPQLDAMRWDADDRLRSVTRGGERTFYVYDQSGQRVRKVTEAGGVVRERIYLAGFELYRERAGAVVRHQRETLHLMDDRRRVAMVETKTVDRGTPVDAPVPLLRYQIADHLGSAALELDHAGRVISFEEYHPYGSTAYRSASGSAEVSLKRYRYTGKERDEESGLDYFGARYYAAWLGRWMSADPAGMADGPNRFAFVRCNPTNLHDPDGRSSTFSDNGEIGELLFDQWMEKNESRYFSFHDSSKKVNHSGFDRIVFDRQTGAVLFVDNKAYGGSVRDVSAFERFRANRADALRTIWKYGDRPEAEAALRAIGRNDYHLVVSNAYSTERQSFSRKLFDQGYKVLDFRTGSIYDTHGEWSSGTGRGTRGGGGRGGGGGAGGGGRGRTGGGTGRLGRILTGVAAVLSFAGPAAEAADAVQTIDVYGRQVNELSREMRLREIQNAAKLNGGNIVGVENTTLFIDTQHKQVYRLHASVYDAENDDSMGADLRPENFFWNADRGRYEYSDYENDRHGWISNQYPDGKYYLNVGPLR
jgi:RHS repeat-associated protein